MDSIDAIACCGYGDEFTLCVVTHRARLNSVLKSYGQHLKAPVAMVRLRLYETLSMLPPHMLEFFFAHTRIAPAAAQATSAAGGAGAGAPAEQAKKYNKFTQLLQMLVSEFTLSDNPANTTSSMLRQLCHADESIVLGTWLQETDHRMIEDQVRQSRSHCVLGRT